DIAEWRISRDRALRNALHIRHASTFRPEMPGIAGTIAPEMHDRAITCIEVVRGSTAFITRLQGRMHRRPQCSCNERRLEGRRPLIGFVEGVRGDVRERIDTTGRPPDFHGSGRLIAAEPEMKSLGILRPAVVSAVLLPELRHPAGRHVNLCTESVAVRARAQQARPLRADQVDLEPAIIAGTTAV